MYIKNKDNNTQDLLVLIIFFHFTVICAIEVIYINKVVFERKKSCICLVELLYDAI